jgi:hypothetical protein
MFRLLLGLALGAWALSQSTLGAVEWVELLAATFLVLNFLSGRCYLWQMLNINTRARQGRDCDRCTETRGNALPD